MLDRIDAMMRELQALREAVLSLQEQPEPSEPPEPSSGSITKQLLGSLGQAAPEELNDTSDLYTELFER